MPAALVTQPPVPAAPRAVLPGRDQKSLPLRLSPCRHPGHLAPPGATDDCLYQRITPAVFAGLEKTEGGLPRRRGRMTRLEDRQTLVAEITSACAAGARLAPACHFAGIALRTFQRWRAGEGEVTADRRPEAARPKPAHALSEAERARIVELANEPRFAS